MATDDVSSVLQTLGAQQAPPSHLRGLEALRALCERGPGCVGLAKRYLRKLVDKLPPDAAGPAG